MHSCNCPIPPCVHDHLGVFQGPSNQFFLEFKTSTNAFPECVLRILTDDWCSHQCGAGHVCDRTSHWISWWLGRIQTSGSAGHDKKSRCCMHDILRWFLKSVPARLPPHRALWMRAALSSVSSPNSGPNLTTFFCDNGVWKHAFVMPPAQTLAVITSI